METAAAVEVKEAEFKVGDIVTVREGGIRMKVSAIDKKTGTVKCTWTRGPGKFTRNFESAALMRAVAPTIVPLRPPTRPTTRPLRR